MAGTMWAIQRTILGLMILLGCLVAAQVPKTDSAMAQLLERRLEASKTGLLLVADGPKGEWKSKMNALSSDPAWMDMDLDISYYGKKAAELDGLLREKYRTGPRPCWVLLSAGGRVISSGTTPPEPAAIGKAATEGKLKTTTQLLREFLRANPDHVEAQRALLRILESKAVNKTKVKLGEKLDAFWPSDERRDFTKLKVERDAKAEAEEKEEQQPKPVLRLSDGDDAAIWGEVADRLGKLFQSRGWAGVENGSISIPDEAKHSQLMKSACRSALPGIEAALRRRPEAWQLWNAWLSSSKILGGRPLQPLLDSLTPLPTTPPDQWPPWAVRDDYVKECQKHKDWQAIKDLLLPAWENEQNWEVVSGNFTFITKVDGKIREDPETGDGWRSNIGPLTEALLNLGESNQADAIVRTYFAKHPWTGLPKKAHDLALRCNQPSLAAQWGAFVPPAK